jgi:hypothetical protein
MVPANGDGDERIGDRQRAGHRLLDMVVRGRDIGEVPGDVAEVPHLQLLNIGFPVG